MSYQSRTSWYRACRARTERRRVSAEPPRFGGGNLLVAVLVDLATLVVKVVDDPPMPPYAALACAALTVVTALAVREGHLARLRRDQERWAELMDRRW